MEEGPTTLRRLGLVRALAEIAEVTDLGDMYIEQPEGTAQVERSVQRVVAAARRQASALAVAYESDCLPITIGGDHTTSLGTALALNALRQSFDVVWLDAHGDFNTPITSPSGNVHGMVLALLAGLTPYLPQIVPPWRLHLWGVRDLAPGEQLLLEALGVDVRNVSETLAEWPDLLAELPENVLLSFDCDCCQPEVAPGTMTPVPGGFERAEILRLVQQLSEARRILALDVVELHPDRDRQHRTAWLARDVVLTVARAQARREPVECFDGSEEMVSFVLGPEWAL
jgi:arginase